jgi:hypothetical protein
MQIRTRWPTAIADVMALVAIVWTVPLAILVVGAPLALLLAAGVWVARLLRGAL